MDPSKEVAKAAEHARIALLAVMAVVGILAWTALLMLGR
jgi:hypothetical protein